MATDCIFCKIIAGEIPAEIVQRDEQVTAFRDLHPLAPTHVLIVTNKHIESVNALTADDEPLVGRMFSMARDFASKEGLAEHGFRLIVNTGPHGGQTIFHLHLHLLGGQKMKHPMG